MESKHVDFYDMYVSEKKPLESESFQLKDFDRLIFEACMARERDGLRLKANLGS